MTCPSVLSKLVGRSVGLVVPEQNRVILDLGEGGVSFHFGDGTNTGKPRPANAGKGNTEGDTHVAKCATQTPNMPTTPSASPNRPFFLLFFSAIFRGHLQT